MSGNLQHYSPLVFSEILVKIDEICDKMKKCEILNLGQLNKVGIYLINTTRDSVLNNYFKFLYFSL